MRLAKLNMGFGRIMCLIILLIFSSFFSVYIKLVLSNTLTRSLQQQEHHILCHDNEMLALLQFKQTFTIDCDASHSAFAYPKVRSWQEHLPVANRSRVVDCCLWDGVDCDEETGRVIGLDLSSSCLYGTFLPNSSLFNLDHLLHLDLSDNKFIHSIIPSSIDRLSKLTRLNLSQSGFSGQVPSQISKLSWLSLLDLSSNVDPSEDGFYLEFGNLSLERVVRNLSRLGQLLLDDVYISSVVPPMLSNLTALRAVSLSGCSLRGELPQDVFLLPHLEEATFSHNENLGGHLPEFQLNSPLSILDLSWTDFSGKLPPSIGNLGSLNVLDLWSSHFSGPIPISLGNLSAMTYLDLRDNLLSGVIPSTSSNLTELISLSLSGVTVSPPFLNSWLLKLDKLTTLGLRAMNIGGVIPSSLGNLTSLTELDLSSNKLVGVLPHLLANLTQLTFLDLGNNQFQGPVPSWFSELVNLQSLALSSNSLVGSPEPFFKLRNLQTLFIANVSLQVSPDASTNSSLANLSWLDLDSCNLTEFPQFLQIQNSLEYLSLATNTIGGRVPQWFLEIARESLLFLDLSSNHLAGFEQPLMFLPWTHLEYFDFRGNKLQGKLPIPSKSMQAYRISDNKLSGVIPWQICHASSLSILDLSDNFMSGRIPDCVGHQLGSSLLALNLRKNNFYGPIPETFQTSCRLKMINLSQNKLWGQLPRSLANCMMLEVLDVGKNHINDKFPSWLGHHSSLQVLVLRQNRFHGNLPNPKSHNLFRNLRIFDLSHNFHTGPLPFRYLETLRAMQVSDDEHSSTSNFKYTVSIVISDATYAMDEMYNYVITIMNKRSETFYSKILSVYRVIDFSSNNFIGRIPSSLGNLRGLQVINFSSNNLEGSIPSSLSKIGDLQSLDLSHNMLSGMIPQELSKLNFLEVFNVSYNRLQGPIPHGEQFDTFDSSSFDGNPRLCGAPLLKKCGHTSYLTPQPLQVQDGETGEGDKLIEWIIISLGCASGFIVGFVIGKICITDRHHMWFVKTFRRRRWGIRRWEGPSHRGN